MSALGQKQTFKRLHLMSALPRKRTLIGRVGMSALCQKQTFCAAANTAGLRTDAMASLSGSRPDFFSLFLDLTDSSLNFVLRD
jgi:hypothetical protein